MFINDFQNSNEYKLHQLLHTLKSVYQTELNLENKSDNELLALKETSEIIKNSIVSESRFNTYNNNPEYSKHMLIMEAIKLFLTEIAPKRRKVVKEDIETEDDMSHSTSGILTGEEEELEEMNPTQSPTINTTKPAAPGMVNVQKDTIRKTIPASQLSNLQKQGFKIVGDDVQEATTDNMDPELMNLMKQYNIIPNVDEGNLFGDKVRKAKAAGDKSFKIGKDTYQVREDWGSSDWTAALSMMDRELSGQTLNPDTIESAAMSVAEFYNDMMGFENLEDAQNAIVSMWLRRRGWKESIETIDEKVSKASKPDYHKLAKEHSQAATAAFDSNDPRDFNKHHDLSIYYRIKSGHTPPKQIVDVSRFMKHVENNYKVEKLNESTRITEAALDHDNYQASMARSELYRNAKYAMDMLKVVKPNDEIQPWIAANLTKAAGYLDKIYHYLDYYNTFEPEQLPEDEDVDPKTRNMALGESTGSIARQNLMLIVEYSTKLFKMIQPGDKLEGWVAMKLTTASDAISSSKHYLDYTQFEKHASDMLANVDSVTEEGTKMSKKSVRESVGQKIMQMILYENQDLEQAQTLLAAKALSDDLQTMAEKVAKMSVEDLMPLVDTMKEQFGPEAAEGYNSAMKQSLELLLKTTTDAKDASDNAILQLQGGEVPTVATDIEKADVEIEAPELPDAEPDDGLGATDAAAGPTDEPLGRKKKEVKSDENLEKTISEAKKALKPGAVATAQVKEMGKKYWDGKHLTKAGVKKRDEIIRAIEKEQDKITESNEWIKSNKQRFISQYGNVEGEKLLYATAWKNFGTKSENYIKAVKMLETAETTRKTVARSLTEHKQQYSVLVNEGRVDDPLNLGYGLEGELMMNKISELDGVISKLKEMINLEMKNGINALLMAEQDSVMIEKLNSIKNKNPYGVIWKNDLGEKKNQFFENEQLRSYWIKLNSEYISEHKLINPSDFDRKIQKLSNNKA